MYLNCLQTRNMNFFNTEPTVLMFIFSIKQNKSIPKEREVAFKKRTQQDKHKTRRQVQSKAKNLKIPSLWSTSNRKRKTIHRKNRHRQQNQVKKKLRKQLDQIARGLGKSCHLTISRRNIHKQTRDISIEFRYFFSRFGSFRWESLPGRR